eukprot:CAMPEP_0202365244 /NCGR_PEP_ID=MMETSP1126-20121109/16319_1 /ASSEMBLY_ACC=CAM_ASM_000457 /TAXON_ID=3047 /ORGANISM="Dunaliella tertiolecta, Strain CCMP1320" /LENGTH=78 /DNA_ID=CAMNT_0048960027 /DNA_START=206 /DNA_END=442 /DNA_ORIENTATION=-
MSDCHSLLLASSASNKVLSSPSAPANVPLSRLTSRALVSKGRPISRDQSWDSASAAGAGAEGAGAEECVGPGRDDDGR